MLLTWLAFTSAVRRAGSKTWETLKKTPAAIIFVVLILAATVYWLYQRKKVAIKLQEIRTQQVDVEVRHEEALKDIEGATRKERKRITRKFEKEKRLLNKKQEELNKVAAQGPRAIANEWNKHIGAK